MSIYNWLLLIIIMAGGYFALFAGYPEMALNCFLTSAIIITFHKKSQNK
jgi:hypothetical protein